MKSYLEKVYAGNIEAFAVASQSELEQTKMACILGNNTWGSKTYMKLYDFVEAVVKAEPAAHWLTVGDGRYGVDGYHLKRMGAAEVTITDIAPALLDLAVARGLIPGYQLMNAEEMDIPDESVDYVLCKEAFHHFPRPFSALYEMLRVCKKGVVLVEPHDVLNSWPFLRHLENLFDKIRHWTGLRLSPYRTRYSYEPVGNFVYKICLRDMERAAGALGYAGVAVRQHNFFWRAGMESIPYAKRWRHPLFYSIGLRKAVADMGRYLGLLPGGMLTVVILKKNPAPALQKSLRKRGFVWHPIKPNPYLGGL